MSEKPTKEHYEDFVYMGRTHEDGKLVHTFMNLSTKGVYIGKKFPYAKRPSIGAIYRMYYTDETRQRWWSSGEAAPHYVGIHADKMEVNNWRIRDEATMMEDEAEKMRRKERDEDYFDSLTIAELKEQVAGMTLRQRRIVLLHIMKRLGL